MRQTLFALMLYAIALTSILSLGLWLVLTEELTVGQLIASVSVIALVVGAFAKIGKSLESYYDLMAATDKVGHLLDLPTLPPSRSLHAGIGPVSVRVRDLTIDQVDNSATLQLEELKVEAGERFALVGGDVTAGLLMAALSGMRTPNHGLIEIGGVDSRDVSRFADGSMVGIASQPEIFQGTIQENVSLSRGSISSNDVRESLIKVGLWNDVLRLSNGMDTVLMTGGAPLSPSQASRLMIARAIAGKPRLLLIDGALDLVSPEIRKKVWEILSDRKQKWTLIVATHDQTIIEQCDGKIELL
jgi:putative ABC transport system ATP-binding protein